MAHSGLLAKGERREMVLLRRHPSEEVFGAQFSARDPGIALAAARLCVEKGADLIDLNCGCPIDSIVRRGLGAALLEKPRRLEKLVAGVRAGLDVPLFVKIRTGFREGKENAVELARVAEAAGADAVTVHGRTREQRYRRPADWTRVAEVASALSIPVIGNGDILLADDARRHLAESGCAAVMAARGALIKPWIFEDFARGADRPRNSDERLAIYRAWLRNAVEHWGADEHGARRIRPFLEFHVDWWRRYVPEDAEATGDRGMQDRSTFTPRDELEAILQASDDQGIHRACDTILEGQGLGPEAFEPASIRRDASAGGWS